eukprot:138178-Rhodomonas_salina.1
MSAGHVTHERGPEIKDRAPLSSHRRCGKWALLQLIAGATAGCAMSSVPDTAYKDAWRYDDSGHHMMMMAQSAGSA